MQTIGIILIIAVVGLYIAWIWYTKKQSGVIAHESGGVQVFDILVKGAYSPSVIKAGFGKPIRINFKRQESAECSRFVNLPDFKIRRELPQGKTVAIEIISAKKGEYVFTCDMGMYQGRLIVE